MRKLAYLFIFACLLVIITLFLSACQGQTPPAPEKQANGQTLTIATSFYPVYIATMNIAGDIPGVNVVNMTQPTTGCLHDYQLRPDDLKTLSEAQILVINGAGMESFMDKVVEQQPGIKIANASEGIQLIKNEGEEGDNPHVWVSLTNAIKQASNIGLQLATLDPDHAAQYSANTTAYIDRLKALRASMHQVLDRANHRDIITFHEAFNYFAQEFNLNIVAVIEQEPGSEPSAAELAGIIETVRSSKIKALFAEPQYAAKAAETIARETGVKVFILDPVVTGPMDPDAYIKIMESNLKILEEALN
ncbi:MAG: High-affinity zinc uptake system binding-protein ZnuA precursor [Pelotomaculum sp. PtaB.Bin104]|nr:MAG: High-affinity zinc uptake system binding-protein ZnuA precursor [Pelotomaculum sp. PtaB.Bin104]